MENTIDQKTNRNFKDTVFRTLFGEVNISSNYIMQSQMSIIRKIHKEPSLELIAKVININHDSGESALSRSTTLQGYSHLINEIRTNQNNGMARDTAIITAIDSCIKQDVLSDFLTEHYSEVSKMLNWEYDADAEIRVRTQESHDKGREEGREEGINNVLSLLKEGHTVDEIEEILKIST